MNYINSQLHCDAPGDHTTLCCIYYVPVVVVMFAVGSQKGLRTCDAMQHVDFQYSHIIVYIIANNRIVIGITILIIDVNVSANRQAPVADYVD